MGDIHIVARNPGVTLDDFVAYLAEDPIGALDGATFAERDAEIANLERWRDALIKQTAEQVAEIAALRAQVAELEAWKAAVPVDAIAFLVGATDASLGETPQAARVVKWWANSMPS